MPNERYVKISMRDRWALIPYDSVGDPAFEKLDEKDERFVGATTIRDVFSDEEIVNLVNRALYGMKYQRETHANRRKAKKEETK